MRKLGSSIAAFTLAMANWVDCSPALTQAADVPSVLRSQVGDEYYPYYLLADPAEMPTDTRSDSVCPILEWAQSCGAYRGHCPGPSSYNAADYSEEGCQANELDDDADYCGDEDSYGNDDLAADDDYCGDEDCYGNYRQADDDVPPPAYQPSYAGDEDDWNENSSYGEQYARDAASSDSDSYAGDEDDWNENSSYGEQYARDAASSDSDSYAGESEDTDVSAYSEESADSYESDYGDEWNYGYRASNRYSGIYGDDEVDTTANDTAAVEDDEPTDSSTGSYDEPCYSDYWTREYGRPVAPGPVDEVPSQSSAYDYESEYGDYQQYNEPGYTGEDWSPEYAPATEDRAPVADAGESWDGYSGNYDSGSYDSGEYDSAELAPIDEEAPTATVPGEESDDNLACVVDAWPTLPSGVKTVIMAMVKLTGSTR